VKSSDDAGTNNKNTSDVVNILKYFVIYTFAELLFYPFKMVCLLFNVLIFYHIKIIFLLYFVYLLSIKSEIINVIYGMIIRINIGMYKIIENNRKNN
jgi:hypothetical protein